MELSPRLCAVAQLVPKGARFADIGTDHAYLPVWLILNGRIDRAIAADLRSGPLKRAQETARRYEVSDRIQFCLCDGLSGIKAGQADTIAIAGMGGETIAHILSAAVWTKRESVTLLLQPMSSQPDLRAWLLEHGYTIAREQIVRENKTLYVVMVVKAGQDQPLTPAELWCGRQSRDPLRGEWLEHLIAKEQRVLNGQLAAAEPDQLAVQYVARVIDGMIEMKKEWDSWQR